MLSATRLFIYERLKNIIVDVGMKMGEENAEEK